MAYANPAKINGKDVLGNQGYGGSLGMDFQTTTPILISDLAASSTADSVVSRD